MAFLKRRDMSGFMDNSFLFSVGMSEFFNIVFRKRKQQSRKSQLSFPYWKSLSEISQISLWNSKSLPQIWGISLHDVQKRAPDSRQTSARDA